MASFITFYLSRIIGNKVRLDNQKAVGTLSDLIVDLNFEKPKVVAAQIKFGGQSILMNFDHFRIEKFKRKYNIRCSHIEEVTVRDENILFLAKHIMDRQIVDMDDRKLERVNDLRLAILASGTFVVAVDVGMEGLLRRLSVAKPIKFLLKPFGITLPSDFILWDDVATIGGKHQGIKLSKEQSKLSTLHPSDLADIIEDLDREAQIEVFSGLDEEQAADVLEEMENDAQVELIENLSLEKAADVLEKMPADEAADILDDLDDEKVQQLLGEMQVEASDEVRELMEYADNTVGSLMSTEHLSFNEEMTVNETLNELRTLKPEPEALYYLYVLDHRERLVASVALRDLVISPPDTKLREIMDRKVIKVYDNDKIDSIAEIISKYNMLAIPVVGVNNKMMGIVIIDDVMFTLMKSRKHRILRDA